jgi:hypothetical protein
MSQNDDAESYWQLATPTTSCSREEARCSVAQWRALVVLRGVKAVSERGPAQKLASPEDGDVVARARRTSLVCTDGQILERYPLRNKLLQRKG